MRPGKAADLAPLLEIWREEASAGQREYPNPRWLESVMGDFDWATRSRVIEAEGRVAAGVVCLERKLVDSSVARLEAVGPDPLARLLIEWGIRASLAHGARVARVWQTPGRTGRLPAGAALVRRWWRMDRNDSVAFPAASVAPGYRLTSQDRDPCPVGVLARLHDEAFREHWEASPIDPETVAARVAHAPDLMLMAVTGEGSPAAFVWAELQELDPGDPRPGPNGLVGSVGTLPAHRRQGLAGGLIAESLSRLALKGARSGSLYVDALNSTGAVQVYGRLGFTVGWEWEIWEFSSPIF